jgi:metal-responsive CopG/Arc/MetJ family transcriptional regulator
MLTIPAALLQRVDATVERDYTTRSDVIRQALLDYLRQLERASGELDIEEAIKILRRKQGMAYLNKMIKNNKLDLE